PGGTTMVVRDGGGGLLLLKLRHPPSSSGRSNGNRRIVYTSIALVAMPSGGALGLSPHNPVFSAHRFHPNAWPAGSTQQVAWFAAEHIGGWPWCVFASHARWSDWHREVGLTLTVRQVQRERQ